MKCDYCDKDLTVIKSSTTSEIESTVVHSNLTLGCTNPDCEIYCGTDLSNPKHVAKTLKVKVD